MNIPTSFGEALGQLLLPPICIILAIIAVISTQVQIYDGYDTIAERAIGEWATSLNSKENITIVLLEDGSGNLLQNNTTQRLIWSPIATINDNQINIEISETKPAGIHIPYTNEKSSFSIFINSNGNVLDFGNITLYKVIN